VVGVLANADARVRRGAVSRARHVAAQEGLLGFVAHQPVAAVVRPATRRDRRSDRPIAKRDPRSIIGGGIIKTAQRGRCGGKRN
jgi:hypothetical protein